MVEVEAAWLPDLPNVRRALSPLGFARTREGSWRAALDARDRLGLARATRKVLDRLLAELLEEDEEGQ